MDKLIIGVEQLEQVKDLALFYPCSGGDLLEPIELFSPYITDFWFVDRGYFSTGHQDTRYYGYDLPADKQPPVLANDDRYLLIRKEIKGLPDWKRHSGNIEPCVLTEFYTHKATGREIRIHRRRGYGFSAILREPQLQTQKLGVFFYRGDSEGEGGSGNHWLSKEHLGDKILARMGEGGLLALDGTDGARFKLTKGVYAELCKYARKRTDLTPEQLIASMNEAKDRYNRTYTCVGYAGRGYGPTMIWQVTNNQKNAVCERKYRKSCGL